MDLMVQKNMRKNEPQGLSTLNILGKSLIIQ